MSFRSKVRHRKLLPDEDIFHDFQWPQRRQSDEDGAVNSGGRPRFEWSARMSLYLIILVVHTDMTFDEICTALKEETGKGFSKWTCRNHWNEIFGYDPSVARISYSPTQRHRREGQMTAFRAVQRGVQLVHANEGTTHARDFQQEAQSWTLGTLQAPHFHFYDTAVEAEISAVYSQGFLSWLKQDGLQIVQRVPARFNIIVTRQHSQRLMSFTAEYRTLSSICDILDSRLATSHDLASMTGVVEEHLREGADPNGTNAKGECALHLAVALGHIPIITLLLEYGADTHTRTHAGESIWQFGAKASTKLMTTDSSERNGSDLLERTMACVRIEFARSTVEFNPGLNFKGRATRVDRTVHHDDMPQWFNTIWPETPGNHMASQQVMVNAVADEGQYWSEPNHFDDLLFLPGPYPSDQPMFEEELDDPWR